MKQKQKYLGILLILINYIDNSKKVYKGKENKTKLQNLNSSILLKEVHQDQKLQFLHTLKDNFSMKIRQKSDRIPIKNIYSQNCQQLLLQNFNNKSKKEDKKCKRKENKSNKSYKKKKNVRKLMKN